MLDLNHKEVERKHPRNGSHHQIHQRDHMETLPINDLINTVHEEVEQEIP